MVAGENHLRAFLQGHRAGHVRGAEVELRLVALAESGMSAAFFLGQNVGLAAELLVRGHCLRLRKNLSALHLVLVYAAKKNADVVAGHCLVHLLAEHLYSGGN